MKKNTWIILGASSAIAKAFIETAAIDTRHFILVGRDLEDLKITAAHIALKYGVACSALTIDLQDKNCLTLISKQIQSTPHKLSLFIAHTLMLDNDDLDPDKISQSIQTNITISCQIIYQFVTLAKKPNAIIYLSSVAGDRGRHSNSLYGATKKTVEIYLDGLKVSHPKLYILSIRLGFIDTRSTYGKAGIFLSQSPTKCAQFCYKLMSQKKNKRYFPWFWRYIMTIIKLIPEFIFKKLKL